MRSFFIGLLTIIASAAIGHIVGAHDAHADTGTCWDVRCQCHRPCEEYSPGDSSGTGDWEPPYPGWPFFPPPDPYAEQKRLANEYAAQCVKLPPKDAWSYCQSALNTCATTDANCDIHRWNLEMGGYKWHLEDRNYPSARQYLEKAKKYCRAVGKCTDIDKMIAGTYRIEQNQYCVAYVRYSWAQATCEAAIASCHMAFGKKHAECRADEWNLARNKMLVAESAKNFADAAAAARASRRYCGGPRLACSAVDQEIARYDALAEHEICAAEPTDSESVATCKSALANCRKGWTDAGACDGVERSLLVEQCKAYSASKAASYCDDALALCQSKSQSCNLEMSLAYGNRGEVAAKDGDLIGALTEFRRGAEACKAGNLNCGPMLQRLGELEMRLERFDRERGEWAPGDTLESAAKACQRGFDDVGAVCGPGPGGVPPIGDEVEVATDQTHRDRRAYADASKAESDADARIDDYERQQLDVIDAFMAGEIKSEDDALKQLKALDGKIAGEEQKRNKARGKKDAAGARYAAKKAKEDEAASPPKDDAGEEPDELSETIYELR